MVDHIKTKSELVLPLKRYRESYVFCNDWTHSLLFRLIDYILVL